MRFTDRVVVATGAGSGIGRVMAGCFAAEGASVADRVAASVVSGGGAIVNIAPVNGLGYLATRPTAPRRRG